MLKETIAQQRVARFFSKTYRSNNWKCERENYYYLEFLDMSCFQGNSHMAFLSGNFSQLLRPLNLRALQSTISTVGISC